MKTRFKYNIQGMTGKLDGLVYYYDPKANQIYVRKHILPKTNPSADRLKLVMANLKLLNPTEGYKQSFKDYLIRYNKLPVNQDNHSVNWTSLYMKMLYAMAKTNPETVNLETLSRAQIEADNLPCRTLKYIAIPEA